MGLAFSSITLLSMKASSSARMMRMSSARSRSASSLAAHHSSVPYLIGPIFPPSPWPESCWFFSTLLENVSLCGEFALSCPVPILSG